MKTLLSLLSILFLAVCSLGASAAVVANTGAVVKVKATGKVYRVHAALRQNARLVRASVVTPGSKAGVAHGVVAAVASEVVDVDNASEGYDAAALSTDHHVRCLIAVEQADAVIYVDGTRAGTSPVEVDWDGRASEKHTVKVSREGMASFEETFTQGVGDAAIYVRLLPTDGK